MERHLDAIDLEAMREGSAIRTFGKIFAMDRACTKSQAKRGVLRGSQGAKARGGMTRFYGAPTTK
jgi:hypothetical protein